MKERDIKLDTMSQLAKMIKKSFKDGTYDSIKLHAELLRLLTAIDRNTLWNIVSTLSIACNEYKE